jgi:arginase
MSNMSNNILSYFNYTLVAKCGSGQKKKGVEEGGEFICNALNIKPSLVLEKTLFTDINLELHNGCELLVNNSKRENYYFQKNDNFNGCELLVNNSKSKNFDFQENQNFNGYEYITRMLDLRSHNDPNIKSLLIGGDHSLGISSVDYMCDKYKDKLRVLWIDAHADINDHITSITGNLHGMPLGYHHISRSDKPIWRKNQYRLSSRQLYYFGIRDLDPAEIELIEKENIGFSNVIDCKLTQFIDEAEILMISFDVDALDPSYLDSTGCLAPDGLKPLDVRFIIDYAMKTDKLKHLDIMEFNPELGDCDKSINCVRTIFL